MPPWTHEPLGLGTAALLHPPRFADARGSLVEVWNPDRLPNTPMCRTWAQTNLTHTVPGALRGLHLQHPTAQHKLVRVVSGRIWDVIVDLVPGSPSHGRWTGRWLSAESGLQLYVPAGFAHGFCVPRGGDGAQVLYMLDPAYRPDNGLVLRWDSPALAIDWPVTHPILSDRDAAGLSLAELTQRLEPTP